MIFVDLDDCLVRMEFPEGPSSKAGVSLLRPGAVELLVELRELAPTKMLTAGMRHYARAINEYHGLGFDQSTIFAREDFFKFDPHGFVLPVANSRDRFPGSILIDNSPPDNELTQAKLRFLGIRSNRLIVVPHFTHQSESLTPLIPRLILNVQKLLKVEQPT